MTESVATAMQPRHPLDLDGLSTPHVLREYACLADGERGVVVGPRGDFAWMCFPRWESDAIFSTLIGGRGLYALTPRGRFVWGGYYEDGTLIWRSRWITSESVIECREALVYPGAPDRALVLRRLMAVRGTACADAVLNPRASFGQAPMGSIRREAKDVWTARTGSAHIRWQGADDVEVVSDRQGGRVLVASMVLAPGTQQDLVLEVAEHAPGGPPEDASALWASTEAEWGALRQLTPASSVGERDVRHSYAVLQGLTSTAGGTVAAATTSLPERAGEGRSYDYRYVWIRDQCLVGQGVAAGGPHPVMDGAVAFVTDRLLDDAWSLSPAYTIAGGPIPAERSLELPGYPGGGDVVGNRVGGQFQLDAFGECLLLLAAAARHGRLDSDGWRAADVASQAIARRWNEPDAGIWELEPALWTESRLSCVAGLRAMSEAGASAPLAARCTSLADTILRHTLAQAVHRSGRWQRAPDDSRVDAGLLLPLARGVLPATDSRLAATVEAVSTELVRDGYVYRYAPDERPLGEAEGAFILCGFVMALVYLELGDPVRAASYFERNRSACGPPALFTEEYDVGERQLRGNLPQAFAHGLMVECAHRQSPEWSVGRR